MLEELKFALDSSFKPHPLSNFDLLDWQTIGREKYVLEVAHLTLHESLWAHGGIHHLQQRTLQDLVVGAHTIEDALICTMYVL